MTHRRRVLFVKPRYWIVVDDLLGAAEHAIDALFQFAPLDVSVDAGEWARARGPRGGALLVRALATAPLKREVREGELSPIRGWTSSRYGERQPAPCLVYSAVARLPLRVAVVLWPVDSPEAAPPRVAPLAEAGHELAGLVVGDEAATIRFAEPVFSVEGG